jgi:hypothetical protein
MELVREELAARGVMPETIRITVREDPRSASLRYTSTYDRNSKVFQVQTALVALVVSRVMLRIQPPLEAGLSVSVLPEGDGEVGLMVIVINQSSLDGWADGLLTEQEFVTEWEVGTIPKE